MAQSIERWPLDRLIPYARTHSDAQVAQIAASIKEFGFVNPILAGSDGVIIAGHGRLLAARKPGMTEVPVIVIDGRLEIEALRDADYDLNLIGFEDDELAQLLAAQEAAEGLTDEDGVPELSENPVSISGDLWLSASIGLFAAGGCGEALRG